MGRWKLADLINLYCQLYNEFVYKEVNTAVDKQ